MRAVFAVIISSRTKRGVPSRITSDGRADRLEHFEEKRMCKNGGILGRSRMKKTAIRFEPELKEEIQSMMTEANATSMADFVRQASEFYIAFLRQKKSINFIAPLLAQTIKNEIESVEKNISSMLFKLAVEQSIGTNIISYLNRIDRETISSLREMCSVEVAENNGIITFEEAMEFQSSED